MVAGGTKLPRSSPHSSSSHSQAASPTSVLRPGRSLTWRALTNSSWYPRSSSTYQHGFQLLAGRLQHHLGDPLLSEPVGEGLQTGAERRVGTHLLAAPAGAIGHADTDDDLVLADVQPGAASVDHLHRGHLLVVLVRRPAGPTDQATLKDVLAATVRGAGKAPHQSYQRALSHQGKPSLAGPTDSHPSWRPQAMGVLPRRKPDAGLAGGRLRRPGTVRISSYFRTL
jgi:hypothetical protein